MGNKKAREYVKRKDFLDRLMAAKEKVRFIGNCGSSGGLGLKQFQIAYQPSFEPGHVWHFHLDDEEWHTYVSEIQMGGPSDLIQATGYAKVGIPSDSVRALWDTLRTISIPIAPPVEGWVGADGTTYELAMWGDHYSAFRFTWWSKHPASWEPMVRPVLDIIPTLLTRPVQDNLEDVPDQLRRAGFTPDP